MLKNASMEMNAARVAVLKSSVSIVIMSWHMHKNIVMRAVNLYNEFAWAQENFDVCG